MGLMGGGEQQTFAAHFIREHREHREIWGRLSPSQAQLEWLASIHRAPSSQAQTAVF